jgi:hypothetical protein
VHAINNLLGVITSNRFFWFVFSTGYVDLLTLVLGKSGLSSTKPQRKKMQTRPHPVALPSLTSPTSSRSWNQSDSDMKKFADALHCRSYSPTIGIVRCSSYLLFVFSMLTRHHTYRQTTIVRISYRLARHLSHHRSQPVLQCLYPLAG